MVKNKLPIKSLVIRHLAEKCLRQMAYVISEHADTEMSMYPSGIVHQQYLLPQCELKLAQGLSIKLMCPLDTPVFALPLSHIRFSSDVVKSHGDECSLL